MSGHGSAGTQQRQTQQRMDFCVKSKTFPAWPISPDHLSSQAKPSSCALCSHCRPASPGSPNGRDKGRGGQAGSEAWTQHPPVCWQARLKAAP